MINAYDGPKTEPWFDDFGDTDGLTQCIPTKEWKDIMEKAPVQSATDAQVGGDHHGPVSRVEYTKAPLEAQRHQ